MKKETYTITKVQWAHEWNIEYIELRNGQLDKVSLLDKLGMGNLSGQDKRRYLENLRKVIDDILALKDGPDVVKPPLNTPFSQGGDGVTLHPLEWPWRDWERKIKEYVEKGEITPEQATEIRKSTTYTEASKALSLFWIETYAIKLGVTVGALMGAATSIQLGSISISEGTPSVMVEHMRFWEHFGMVMDWHTKLNMVPFSVGIKS